jgi:hypothetical protein
LPCFFEEALGLPVWATPNKILFSAVATNKKSPGIQPDSYCMYTQKNGLAALIWASKNARKIYPQKQLFIHTTYFLIHK